MNMHELPMILFTVIAQMAVGSFLVLGLVQWWLSSKTDGKTVDRMTIPILYVIGPVMVLGLLASMFHMNNPINTFNVIRNVGSSWLTREILFGVGFAGLGFAFALMQWFRIGTRSLRQALGILTGVVGIGLIISMAMIYQSLEFVPAWNTPTIMVFFFGTAILLGALGVAAAMLTTAMIRHNTEQRHADTPIPVPVKDQTEQKAPGMLRIKETTKEIHAPMSDEEWSFAQRIIQGLLALAMLAAVAIFITYGIHTANLAGGDQAAQQSAQVFSSGFAVLRLILLGLAAIALALVAYKMAGNAIKTNPAPLAWTVIIAFTLALISEFMGRSLHYDSMTRIGI